MLNFDELTKNQVSIDQLFDSQGNIVNPIDSYFDEDGDVIESFLISLNYMKYPSETEIVKMHYADVFGNETSGFYSPEILFKRAS